jgi:uncharacterized protein (DUF1810 family)
MADGFDLHRFVAAQEPVYGQVRRELAMGRKATHWMWFIFPQIRGLGRSAMSQKYWQVATLSRSAVMAGRVLINDDQRRARNPHP